LQGVLIIKLQGVRESCLQLGTPFRQDCGTGAMLSATGTQG
jgi:hypothetical protein